MKGISTFFATIAIVIASQNLNAQTCASGTAFTAFSTNTFNTTSEGFTGDFSYSSQGSGTGGVLVSQPGSVTMTPTLTTPAYFIPNSLSTVNIGFELSGPAKVNTYAISAVYSGGAISLCSGTLVNNSVQQYISVQNIPSVLNGKNVTFVITFTVQNNGNQVVIIDNFTTNITLAQAALPVNFTGLEAKKVAAGTQLTWKVAQEENVRSYELQRSTDGVNFTAIGTTSATGSSSYSLTDYTSSSAAVYYRVKNTDNDGRYKFSTTIRVEGGSISFLKKAFPLPAVNEVFIQHDAASAGAVITLSSQDGRIVKSIAVQAGSMQTRIELTGLNSGLYLARYDNGSGNAETLKVVKQ